MRRAIPAFATLIALSQTATAGNVSCAVVRFYVAKYSEAAAVTWARGHGASDAEIEAVVREIAADAGITDPKQLGRIMKPALDRLGSGADGGRVREIAQRVLGG